MTYDCVDAKSPVTADKPKIVVTQYNVVHISCLFWPYNSGLRLRHLHLALTVWCGSSS